MTTLETRKGEFIKISTQSGKVFYANPDLKDTIDNLTKEGQDLGLTEDGVFDYVKIKLDNRHLSTIVV
jgi:hypothetical protein